MEYKLLPENHESLRQVSTLWDYTVDGSPIELVKHMAKIMFANNGIGLAAPQIGLHKRLFIMGNEHRLIACVNPEIIEGDNKNAISKEGCLSFPNLWLNVKRHDFIKVKYYDVDGVETIRDFSGLMSRVYQHERDHLDGICYDTLVAKLSLELAKNRRKKGKKF